MSLDVLSSPRPRILRALSVTHDMEIIQKFVSLDNPETWEDDATIIQFLNTLNERHKLVPVVTQVLQMELEKNRFGLLREGSLGSSLLRNLWFHFEGKKYLQAVVVPLYKEVSKNTKKGPIEIDPIRCAKGEDYKKNAAKITAIVTNFLNNFFKSRPLFPPNFDFFMSTCYKLIVEDESQGKEHLGLGFADSAFRLFGAFFLLRFICPSIVSPYKFGITKKDSLRPGTLRTLVIVSKVIQGIANLTEFGEGGKELYMGIFNEYVQMQFPMMMSFIHKLLPSSAFEES